MTLPRRDDLGRFAPKLVPRRDDFGRFAPGRLIKPRRRLPPRPPRRPPAGLLKKPSRKFPAKPPKKPPRKLPAKPPKKPPRKPPRKPPAKPPRKPPRKPLARLPKKPSRKPPVKPPRRKRRKPAPPILEQSKAAEAEMQAKMISLLETTEALYGNLGLDLAIKTFINVDGTVDGELRIGNLPDSWRTEEGMLEMIASLSAVFSSFRPFDEEPSMGGKFWISFGVRFGPQNESEMEGLAELYKRFRGMFQTGTYPTQAWHLAAIMNSLVIENQGLRVIIDGIMRRHGLPPSVILVRFIWTPEKDKKGKPVRPGRYADELGSK